MADDHNILIAAETVELVATKGTKPTRLRIIAYTGGTMNVSGFGDVVIDLSGLTLPASLPILSDHENKLSSVIATGVPSIEGAKLIIVATLAASVAAEAVRDLLTSGVALQASVGATPVARREISAGQSVKVNGKEHTAGARGLTVIDKSVLREVSVTPLGADSSTSVSIAAGKRKTTMLTTKDDPKFRAWVIEMGSDPDKLTEQQLLHAQASYEGREYHPPVDNSPEGEAKRIEGITALAATADVAEMLKAKGIANNWTVAETELAIYRATMPQAHAPYAAHRSGNPNAILEAAFLGHLGHEDIAVKQLGADVMQRGRELRITSLFDLVKASFQLHGMPIPLGRDEMIRAGFSTMSLPGVLGNAASKMLLDAYNAFPSVVRLIFKKLSAKNFKEHTNYRMTAATTFEKVGPAGELKHGKFAESAYPFKVDTYGKLFKLTRQSVIDDDLQAFESMPRQIGRGAAEAIEDLAWTLVLANTGTFFGVGNLNYISGGASVLGSTALASAVATMIKQVDENGKPISVFPKFLVVPPELKATADELYVSRTVNTGGASTESRVPNANAFHGLYEPLVTPYLSNTSYSGSSLTAWFLFGNPNDVAAFGLAYLNGNESPTVETADSDFSTLGIQFRGFLDFGVCQIDPRGAVKSSGA